jgi:hypothetical protein
LLSARFNNRSCSIDDDAVLLAGKDGLDKAELPQAPRERI